MTLPMPSPRREVLAFCAHTHSRTLAKGFSSTAAGFCPPDSCPLVVEMCHYRMVSPYSLPFSSPDRPDPTPDSHRRRQCRLISKKPSHTHTLHSYLTYKVFPGQSLLSSPGGLTFGSQMPGSYLESPKIGEEGTRWQKLGSEHCPPSPFPRAVRCKEKCSHHPASGVSPVFPLTHHVTLGGLHHTYELRLFHQMHPFHYPSALRNVLGNIYS